jgi:PAS domain S-box-containing protein
MNTMNPQWTCIREDGTSLPGNMHPALVALQTGKEQCGVIIGLYKPGGELVWLCMNAKPLFKDGDSKTPSEVVCSFTDITPIKQTELALRKSEQRWKFALEGAGDGLWEYHLLTGEVFYSNLYKQMIGYTDNELRNTVVEWRTKIHPDDLYLIEAVENRYDNRDIDHHSVEYRIRNKAGDYTWVLDRGMVIERTPEGKPLKIIGTNKNITERKHNEEKIKSNERRFRAIFNSTFQGICLLKPDGVLLEANETALDFGGLRAEDVINRPFWEAGWWAASAATRKRLKQSIRKAAKGEFIRYEVEVLSRKGVTSWVDFSIKPIKDETGKIVLLIPEGRDVNKQHLLQQKLSREEAGKKQAIIEAIIGAQERERQEISYELHDNVNQLLSTGLLVLDVAHNFPDNICDYIQQGRHAIQKAIDEIRKLTHSLSPSSLDFVGLSASIEDIMKEINPTGKLHISFVRERTVNEKMISASCRNNSIILSNIPAPVK